MRWYNLKILAYNTSDNFDGYRPEPFTLEYVNYVLEKMKTEIIEKYSRRYKKLEIDFDDINYNENSMKANIILYNNTRLIASDEFEFIPYSDYWDKSDYNQHLDTTVSKFVEKLVWTPFISIHIQLRMKGEYTIWKDW